MTQIEPYRPPAEATAYPLKLEVNGATYVLAQGDGHQVVDSYRQTYIQPAQAPVGPVLNGVQQVWTPQGYVPSQYAAVQAPYHAHPANPPWLRNHYTRATGILIGAACIGTVLFIVIAALLTLVTWAMANLMTIALTIIMVFFGGMMLLGKLASARHGHPIRR